MSTKLPYRFKKVSIRSVVGIPYRFRKVSEFSSPVLHGSARYLQYRISLYFPEVSYKVSTQALSCIGILRYPERKY